MTGKDSLTLAVTMLVNFAETKNQQCNLFTKEPKIIKYSVISAEDMVSGSWVHQPEMLRNLGSSWHLKYRTGFESTETEQVRE